MNQETAEMRQMLLELGERLPDTRLFRNNVGIGYQGRMRNNGDGSVTLFNWRMIKFGLCKGSSDLIGVTKVLITPDMVGRHVGVITAFEQKTASGKAKDAQTNFIRFIKEMGGISSITRNSDEAVDAIKAHTHGLQV